MWFPLDWNVRPYPGHKVQFSAGPQVTKTCLSEIHQVRLFVWAVHYIAVTCLSAGRDKMKLLWVVSFMALTFNDSYYTQNLVWWLIQWCNNLAKCVNYISSAWNPCSHPDLCIYFARRLCLLRQCATFSLPWCGCCAHMLWRQSSRNPGQRYEKGQYHVNTTARIWKNRWFKINNHQSMDKDAFQLSVVVQYNITFLVKKNHRVRLVCTIVNGV